MVSYLYIKELYQKLSTVYFPLQNSIQNKVTIAAISKQMIELLDKGGPAVLDGPMKSVVGLSEPSMNS